MNRCRLLAATLLVSLSCVGPADAGWYAGFDAGNARSDATTAETPVLTATTARTSGSTTGFRLRGGYQFGRFFALEAAYVNFGDTESHFDPVDCRNGAPGSCPLDVRTSLDGIVGTAMAILPIGDHWFLDARLGWGKFEVETQSLGATVDIGGDNENGGFHYGLGGGYRFNDHWEVMLDYSEYNQQDRGQTLSGDFGYYNLGETSVTSLGISYRW